MNFRGIAYVMGTLLLVTGGAQLFPVLCALIYGEGDFQALLISAGVSSALGLLLRSIPRREQELGTREAIIQDPVHTRSSDTMATMAASRSREVAGWRRV